MRIAPLWLFLLIGLAGPSFCRAETDQSTLPFTNFPIGYWCGPPADFTTIERYREIKDAGFTFAMPPCSATSPELNKKILDLCEAVGLKAFVTDARMPLSLPNDLARARLDAIVEDYSKHPALAGYFYVDEPGAGAFGGLGEVVAYLKTRDPAHPTFINLLPNYANAQQLGTTSYDDHVRKFIEQVQPQLVSYDHYHFTTSGDRAGFLENLISVRNATVAKHLPF